MSRAGKILKVDLTDGSIEKIPTARYTRDYIGGPAIGARLIYEHVSPGVRGKDPENMLTINTGPLTGTLLGNKCNIMAKSPKMTNSTLVTAGMGGQLPSEIKFAGYDNIAITGKADGPVYLFIENEEVEIKDAKHLWGLDTEEVQVRIKKELKDPDVQIACIGPGGENGFVGSCIIHDIQNSASQGGHGAVMGSKNLKAVAVRGTKGLKIADREAFLALWQEYWDGNTTGRNRAYMLTSHKESLSTHADEYALKGMAQWGYGPDASFIVPEVKKEDLLGEFDRKYRVGSIGCTFCPTQCKANYDVPGLTSGGCNCFVYATMRYPVKNLNTKVWFKALDKLQKYGMDCNEITGIAGWLMLLYQEGIITAEDTDGVPMEWGSEEAIMTLIDKIAMGEGFGRHFNDGIVPAAKAIADGNGFFLACQDRNFSVPVMLPERGVTLSGVGGTKMLQLATEFIWFHPPYDRHGGYALFAPIFGLTEQETLALTEEWLSEFAEKRTGNPDAWKPEVVKGKAPYVAATENIISASDLAGNCDGPTARTPHAGCIWDVEHVAGAIAAATGERCTTEKLLETVQRRRLLELSYNILCDQMIGDLADMSPALMRTNIEPVPDGPFKGQAWDLEGSIQAGEEYCTLRGVDPDTGVPTREALEKVGLKDVADRLEEPGEETQGSSTISVAGGTCPV
jgi:aldehyde:ferredoxin oxidoreductase